MSKKFLNGIDVAGLAVMNNGARILNLSNGSGSFLTRGISGDLQARTASEVLTDIHSGTTAQYVRGNGTYATFPTLISAVELSTGTATTERLISAERLKTWVNSLGFLTSLPAHTLGSHSDVTIGTLATTNYLGWNGTAWINRQVSYTELSNVPSTFAPSAHTHSAADITSGTLPVARGGTGATTFTSGNVLVGAGTGAVTTVARSGIDTRTSFPPEAHTLTSHSDVTITSPATNHYISWNGTAWVNTQVSYTQLSNVPTTFAPSAHTHSAADITSGTLPVARGGTGATTFTSGNVLIGAGTGAVTTASRSGIDTRASFPPDAHTLTSHSDVTISSATTGQLLRWSGTAWANWTADFAAGNSAITAVGLTTTTLTLTRAAGNLTATVPTWNQNTTGSAATLTTARTLTIGSTGKTFNGSANVQWTHAEMEVYKQYHYAPMIRVGSWSRIATTVIQRLGGTYLLALNHTRTSVVVNCLLLIRVNHPANSDIIQLSSGSYSQITVRCIPTGDNMHIEVLDTNVGTGDFTYGARLSLISEGDATVFTAYTAGSGTASSSIVTQTGFYKGDIIGNASTVTNGVYTEGNQTINGTKTFSGTVNAATFNATSTTDGGFQGIAADSATAPSYTWTSDLTTGMWRSGTGAIGFTTGGVNRITINSSGISGAGSGLTSLNASNLASGTVPDARLSGTYSGFTHKMDGANTTFTTPNSGSSNTAARTVYGLAEYRSSSSAQVGALVFIAPNNTSTIMYKMEVSGMIYAGGPGFNFEVQGYRTTGTWSNMSLVHKGISAPDVRWGVTPAGHNCLIIGQVGTSWSYPHVVVTRAMFSHTNAADAHCTGWTVAVVTDISTYTNVSAVISPSQITGTSNTSGTVTSVAAGNGMVFTTITGTGTVTMGTPDTLTASTSNGLTASSHTHAITTTSVGAVNTIVQTNASGGTTFTGTVNATTFNATSTTDGGFQGIAADTAAAPSFTWTGALNTGMWHPTTTSIGFTTAGVNKWTINSTGVLESNGAQTIQTSTGNLTIQGSILSTVSGSSIQSRRFVQDASGVPTSNLGAPSVTEMALFQEQFSNKTEFYALANVTFESFNGTVWTDVTSTISETNRRRFLGGDANGTVTIPNGTQRYRITVRNNGTYVFLNALYMYFSTSGNNTQVHISKKRDDGSWIVHTDSSVTVSSWPGHLYLPFSSIPWSLASTASHFNEVRVEFVPTWTHATNALTLNSFQIWGGYPSGKRTIYGVDEFKNVTFPANITGTQIVSTGGNSDNWNTAFGWGNHASVGYLTGTGAAGRVAYWNGTSIQTSDSTFTYSSGLGINVGGFVRLNSSSSTSILDMTGSSVGVIRSASTLRFDTNGVNLRWTMLSTGVLESNGAQTIQTSGTEVLNLQGNGGNVGIFNSTAASRLSVTGEIGSYALSTDSVRGGKIVYGANSSGFLSLGGLQILASRANSNASAGRINFLVSPTASANATTENTYLHAWSIMENGVFQSSGAQTIRTSTGALTLGTAGGNGNIVFTPNGTGSLQSSSTNAVQLRVLRSNNVANSAIETATTDGSTFFGRGNIGNGVFVVKTFNGDLAATANRLFEVTSTGNILALGTVTGNGLGVTNTSNTTGIGLSLYGGATTGMPSYGMVFAGTATFGNHGSVTGDWATYLTMGGATTRGWIFKSGNDSGGNVASISATGVATFAGDVIAFSTSDNRLKDYMEPIGNALDKIKNLIGYRFVWNAKQSIYKTGTRDIGVSAQEVEKIFPELVDTRLNGYKAVKYDKLVAVLIQGVNELQKEIQDLKSRI
jgi:hypothetical protein